MAPRKQKGNPNANDFNACGKSKCSREVNVPLLTFSSVDKLNFSLVTDDFVFTSSNVTRYKYQQKKLEKPIFQARFTHASP
jgi:hypothetical protein